MQNGEAGGQRYGQVHYIDDILEAEKVLAKQIGGTLLTTAKDVKIQVEGNPAHAEAHRLVGGL